MTVREILKALIKEYFELRDKGLSIDDERKGFNELLDKYEKLLDR